MKDTVYICEVCGETFPASDRKNGRKVCLTCDLEMD
jgi:formylmethanofuran dehydrogenase subunit E